MGPLAGSHTLSNTTLLAIAALLDGAGPVVLVPYATPEARRAHLTDRVEQVIGRAVVRLDTANEPLDAIFTASAIIVAGGNAWCLAHHVRQRKLVGPIRQRVAEGVPFLAWGAGAVMASPSLMTTSDLPECQPPGLDGLHLVPFHVAALPAPCRAHLDQHCAECSATEQRIAGLSTRHSRHWIVGLDPDAAILVVDDDVDVVSGDNVPVFRAGRAERGLRPGADGRFLLDEPGERRHVRSRGPKPCRR
jgi:dipeptidase E